MHDEREKKGIWQISLYIRCVWQVGEAYPVRVVREHLGVPLAVDGEDGLVDLPVDDRPEHLTFNAVRLPAVERLCNANNVTILSSN